MSHRSKRGKQSVTAASTEPTAGEKCNVNSCNCSRSVPDFMDGDESTTNKIKRLRTRKERNKIRVTGEVTSNRKSNHHHHHHHHHHQHPRNHLYSKDKEQSHSCRKTSSQWPQRKEARFAKLFPSALERSVITTNRLIGHQGLFNNEVKSFDIERLLSEQRNEGRQRQPGIQDLDAIQPVQNTPLSSPCSNSEANLANSSGGVVVAKDADVALYQEKTIVDCQSHTHGSDITPGQRPQIPGMTAENENQQPTNIPCCSLKCKSKKTKAVVSNMEQEASSTAGKENVKRELKKVNTQVNASTPKNQTLSLKHSPNSSVSAVAGRLCRSLQLQERRRRDVLAESREVLLLTIQEKHGPQFQENLLTVQRRLSSDHIIQGLDGVQPTITSDNLVLLNEFFTAIQGKTLDQSCFEIHKKASGKSSRKQKYTNWKSPPQTNRDVEWMTSPREDEEDSSCFGLCLGPSASLPSQHYSSYSPVSQWAEADPPIPQPWDKRLNSARTRQSADIGLDGGCSLNLSTAMRLGSSGLPEANRDSVRHPFLRYLPGQPAGYPADPWHHPGNGAAAEFVLGSLATSSPTRYSQKDYRHPFYHFSRLPTNPFPKPYHGDMLHYPPSQLLDQGPSAALSSFNSPERWSFPPMRLY